MDAIDLISQGKIKRYFRATRKINTPNLISHITQRAAGKDLIFLENDDYLSMLVMLKEFSHRYSIRMYAFCLMPNHAHLLLSPSKKNVYDAMRDLFSRYAMRFNRKYERKGHLFGGPYRQAICLDDSYLLAASLYIHLNPVKAGLAEAPQKYRWSSCRLYYEDDAPQSFIDPDFILGLLSKEELKRRDRYRLLLNRGRELMTGNVLEQKDAIERFKEKIASIFPLIFKRTDRERQVARFSGIDLLSLEELERYIQSMKTGNLPNKPGSREAKRYLIEQLIARGFKRSEISERLNISTKTIYNILKSPS